MIKELFKKWSCCHEWELVNKTRVYKYGERGMPYRIEATFVCKKCGKFKKIDL